MEKIKREINKFLKRKIMNFSNSNHIIEVNHYKKIINYFLNKIRCLVFM